MNDRLSEQLTQEPHFCLLQAAAAEEPRSQRHTRPLNRRTVLIPLFQRDPCEMRTCQCRRTRTRERRQTHAHNATLTTVPTDPAQRHALKLSSIPHRWSTLAIFLPCCTQAPPPSSLPALPWVNREPVLP